MAKCTEEGCNAAIDGKCINNLGIDTCPHYSNEDIIAVDIVSDSEIVESKEVEMPATNVIDVYSGKSLGLKEVNRISTSSLTRLIIFAGLPDAGKTTLILSLMHLFQTATSFENYLFAGSATLLDFEEKSHPSKIDSGKDKGDTARTRIEPPKFLHLKVANQNNTDNQTDLLFTDISGELFIALKDNAADAKNFTLATRADHFALFYDTERITNIKERANARTSGIGILRSLSEAGTLEKHTRVQVIFSRWDLFSDKGKENHNEFIKLLKQDIITQFGDKYQIDFFEVSARPKVGTLEFGYGINNLFPVWVEKSLLDKNVLITSKLNNHHSQRQFLQYQFNQ